MAVSSGTQSVTLRDGVNIWDKDVTVDQLFTGDVKGRVLLDKLLELYQATVKTQNNKPPSNLVILWSCIAVQCSNDFAHHDSTYLLLIWMIFRHIHNHWRVWHGQWVCLAIFDSTCSIMLRWNSIIFENKTWFNSSLPGRFAHHIHIHILCGWHHLSGWGREENLAFLSRRYRQQPEHSLFGETQELGKTHDLQPSQPSGCKASICAFGEGQGDRGIGPWWNVGSGAGGGAGWPQRPTSSPELCVSNWGLLSSHHWGQRERKLADHMP